MKIIDIKTWKGRKHYEWFKEYKVPYYNVTMRLDITKFYNYIKKEGYSFFIPLMYIVNIALNEIEEFRLRIRGEEVILYDELSPAYTIMTDDGIFDNCENEFVKDFKEYYHLAKEAIIRGKKGIDDEKKYNDPNRLDQLYFTCLPWIDFLSVTHPMTDDNNSCIPRIIWGKYTKKDENVEITMGIQVNHALVDGKPLCDGFNKIQEFLNEPERYLK
ncbi:MAG: CatA-like O-acetyltransferase [Bacilli bacterium]|nr:CatA-like O-acetyltransferase [Bacilli bacterium]